MTAGDSDLSRHRAQAQVVTLIPGEHYVAFFGSEDGILPDDDAVEELRILAYTRRNKETLGPIGPHDVITLAEAVAGGIITNALWAECQAAARYVKRRRTASHPKPIESPAEATDRALEAIQSPSIPVPTAPSPQTCTVSGIAADGAPWTISCQTDDGPIEVHLDASGMVADIILGAVPAGNSTPRRST